MSPEITVELNPEEDVVFLTFKYEVEEPDIHILPATVAAWLSKAIINELAQNRGDTFTIKAPTIEPKR